MRLSHKKEVYSKSPLGIIRTGIIPLRYASWNMISFMEYAINLSSSLWQAAGHRSFKNIL
jgi:hypothetical protein